MSAVTLDTVDTIAAKVWAAEIELRLSDPAGPVYSYRARPNIYAADVIPIGGTYPRRTFLLSLANGEAMAASWGQTQAVREYDGYGPDYLAGQFRQHLEAGWTIEAGAFYGPHAPTLQDKIAAADTARDAFRTRYGAAWAARDFAAMGEAARLFRVEFPDWTTDGDPMLHDSAATMARNVRGEEHPPRVRARWNYRHTSTRKGFAAHVERERVLRDTLAKLRALPGFDPEDDRDVIPVVMQWTGGKVRHFRRSELFAPSGQFLHPVKPSGEAMPRARSEYRDRVESIKPARCIRAA